MTKKEYWRGLFDWDKEIRFLKKLLKQYKSEFDRLVRNGKPMNMRILMNIIGKYLKEN